MFALATVSAFVYAVCVEYLAHRYAMHRGSLGMWYFWQEHAIEHHHKGRNDINLEISPITALVLGSPLLAWCPVVGWSFAFVVVSLALGYCVVWTALHKAHHGIGCLWLRRMPGYAALYRHHLLHHLNPTKNFGAVFIFSDRLFGTLLR